MATHDRFKHIEEYEHILKTRHGAPGESEPNAEPHSIIEVDSEGGQDLASPIKHSDDEDDTGGGDTAEHNGSSKDIDFKRPRLVKGRSQKYGDDTVSKSHRTPTSKIRPEGRKVKTQHQSQQRTENDDDDDRIDREKIEVNSPYYDANQQVSYDDIRSFKKRAKNVGAVKETPPLNFDARRTPTSRGSRPRKVGSK